VKETHWQVGQTGDALNRIYEQILNIQRDQMQVHRDVTGLTEKVQDVQQRSTSRDSPGKHEYTSRENTPPGAGPRIFSEPDAEDHIHSKMQHNLGVYPSEIRGDTVQTEQILKMMNECSREQSARSTDAIREMIREQSFRENSLTMSARTNATPIPGEFEELPKLMQEQLEAVNSLKEQHRQVWDALSSKLDAVGGVGRVVEKTISTPQNVFFDDIPSQSPRIAIDLPPRKPLPLLNKPADAELMWHGSITKKPQAPVQSAKIQPPLSPKAQSALGDITDVPTMHSKVVATPSSSATSAGDLRHQLRSKIYSKRVEAFCVAVIMCNAVFIGIQTDYTVKNPFASEPDFITIGNLAFFVFFWAELGARILVDPPFFFQGPDKLWNYFDLFLMLSGTFQMIIQSESAGAYVLRVLRAGRIMRIAPAIKTHPFFRELRLMVFGLYSCLRGLFWAGILLITVFYLFAMVFVGEATTYIKKQGPDLVKGDNETVDNLRQYFGSLPLALRSLFEAISGGNDWSTFSEPLFEVGDMLGYFFLLYIFIVFLGFLNVMTGVFVDSALASSVLDAQNLEAEEEKMFQETMAAAQKVFTTIGGDRLTKAEFEELLQTREVVDFFRSLELQPEEAVGLFHLLDVDRSEDLSLDEFVQGSLRLKGGAKKIHVATIMDEQRRSVQMHLENHNQICERMVDEFNRLEQIVTSSMHASGGVLVPGAECTM
jgi:hypothetical protein